MESLHALFHFVYILSKFNNCLNLSIRLFGIFLSSYHPRVSWQLNRCFDSKHISATWLAAYHQQLVAVQGLIETGSSAHMHADSQSHCQ